MSMFDENEEWVETVEKTVEEVESLIDKLKEELKDCNCRGQVKVVHSWNNSSIWIDHEPDIGDAEIVVFDFPNGNEHLYVVVYGNADTDVVVASGTAKQVVEQLHPNDFEKVKNFDTYVDWMLNYTASRIVETLDEYNKGKDVWNEGG